MKFSNTLSEIMAGDNGDVDFLLDVNTACINLHLSDDRKTVSRSDKSENYPETPERFQHCPQVLSSQRFSSGQHYWDVDVGGSRSWRVGICYPSIDRGGGQSWIGDNNKSWCLQRDLGQYSVIHERKAIQLSDKILSDRIRIYLDSEAGQISFYFLHDLIRPLHTFTTTFTEPLHAALCVGVGCVKIFGRTNVRYLSQSLASPVYADLLLDINTAGNFLYVAGDGKTAFCSQGIQNQPKTPERFQYPQVLSSQSFSSGRHYWEVDVGGSDVWSVGMCYPSIDRRGGWSGIGDNNKSWGLDRAGIQYSLMHDRKVIQLSNKIPSDRVRIYLDYEAGKISFYALCNPIKHLHTFTATFTEPLHAALWVGEGYIKITGRTNIWLLSQALESPVYANLLLDIGTAGDNLHISDDRKTVSCSHRSQNHTETPERFQCPQVLSSQSFSSGRHYWEVDVGGSDGWCVGMCYPSIDRRGGQSGIGYNNKSWGLRGHYSKKYSVIHGSKKIPLPYKTIWEHHFATSDRVGICLDYQAGQISFYALCDSIRHIHLHTFFATFTEPLHAALHVCRIHANISVRHNMRLMSQIFKSPVYADILLDVNTAGERLHISDDRKTASWLQRIHNFPETPERFQCPQVLSTWSFSSGRHYWEVDVGGSIYWAVGMSYPSTDRSGGQLGIVHNNKSWGLYRWCNQYSMEHHRKEILLLDKIPCDRVRIYLDYEAGQISFYALCDPIRLLYTFTGTFTEPLHAALWVGHGFISISRRSNIRTEHHISEFPQTVDIDMDVNTANNHLNVSDDRKKVSWTFDEHYHPETPLRFIHYPQVLSRRYLSSGRHYWEVDVRESCAWRVGMCYLSIERRDVPQSLIGNNNKSWSLTMDGGKYSARHDGNQICLPRNINCSTVRISLDYEAGQISFYALSDPIRPLHTFTATFTEPLHAVLCVWEGYISVLN